MSTHIIQTHADPPHQQQCVNEIVTLDQSQAVLRQLVDSGFLALVDIGRLLICTSKSTTECLYNDDPNDLWMFLLKQRCSLKEDTLSASKMTAKEIFLSTFQKKSEKPPMQIRNLRYSPQDYLIIVNICDKEDDGRSLFSRAIPGQKIPDFFERGCFSLKDVNLDLHHEDKSFLLERFSRINVYIHRIADNRVMSFFESEYVEMHGSFFRYCTNDELEMADVEYSQYLFEEFMGGQGYDFCSKLELQFHDDGCYDGCEDWCDSGWADGEVPRKLCDGSCQDAYNIYANEPVSITLETMIIQKGNPLYFPIPGNQNVTFAHFLENMYAWDK
jgi:hypothetical protein